MKRLFCTIALLTAALFASPAPAAMGIVQHHGAIHSNTGITTDGSVTLAGAPTNGNLLIAAIGCNITKTNIVINTSYWTEFDDVESPDNGNAVVMTMLYHYVGASESAALPKMWTTATGGTYWTDEVWEVSGVSGTWNTDFLFSDPLWNTSSNVALPQFPTFTTGMALTAVASYNSSSSPASPGGSWTLDDSNHNASNFGSAAGAHRVLSAGNTIDGTWSQGTSAPYGGELVILTGLQPASGTGVYPRHIARSSNTNGTGLTSAYTVPWAPKTGSLLLAFLNYKDGTGANPTINGSNWTDYKDVTLTNKSLLALYRYVQGGDTAALPAIASAANQFYSVTYVELGNGSGTFATDNVSNKAAGQASGTTLVTTSDTTTAKNQFALIEYGNYNTSTLASQSGFTNYIDDSLLFNNYGAWFTAFEFFPNSGSTVQATLTPGTTSTSQSYVQSIFKQGGLAVPSSGFFHGFP